MPRYTQRTTERAATGQNRCQNCNSFISFRFARVFGNNDDQVDGCLHCANLRVLRNGEAGSRRR